MALYWQNNYLNTFDKVAACYESIKPIRGKQHKDQDVRPLGDRARKWERIKKINNNCYLLMDGYYSGDDVFPTWYYGGKAGVPTEAEMVNLAPIVWRRHRDGTTTIKIRNGTGRGAHNGRYSFLDRHLPSGMRFIIRNGKHFVTLGGTEYYLAKSNTVAGYALPPSEAQRYAWNKDFTTRDDGVALTFRIKNGVMSFEDGGKPLPVPPKVRVDKVAKAKMKDAIAEFRDWAFTMYPLLPVKDREYVGRMDKEVREFMGSGHSYGWGMTSKFQSNPEITRKIICDPDHELRLHLMYALMGETDYHWHLYNTPEEHVQKVKAQFNRHINKLCGFVKAVRG